MKVSYEVCLLVQEFKRLHPVLSKHQQKQSALAQESVEVSCVKTFSFLSLKRFADCRMLPALFLYPRFVKIDASAFLFNAWKCLVSPATTSPWIFFWSLKNTKKLKSELFFCLVLAFQSLGTVSGVFCNEIKSSFALCPSPVFLTPCGSLFRIVTKIMS